MDKESFSMLMFPPWSFWVLTLTALCGDCAPGAGRQGRGAPCAREISSLAAGGECLYIISKDAQQENAESSVRGRRRASERS